MIRVTFHESVEGEIRSVEYPEAEKIMDRDNLIVLLDRNEEIIAELPAPVIKMLSEPELLT